MLRTLLRTLAVLLLSIVLISRFGFTDLLASEISSSYLVEQANKDRAKRNLSPLKYNKKLERAAFLKAENMFKMQYWAHYGPNKESPWQFILQSGYTYAYAGENLAKGFTDSQSVHDAWMASPTHRANILDGQFQDVGIAVVKGNLLGSSVFLVVQMFGSPTYKADGTSGSTDKNPSLKIISPKDGDILEDGVSTISGEAKDMGEPSVTMYLNQALLGSAQVKDSKFSLASPLTAAEGDQTLTAKAVGPEDVYMIDSVVVTVVNKGADGAKMKSCISGKQSATDLVITYTCTRENSALSATIGNTRYTQGKNVKEMDIPISSLPQEDAPVILSITFADGKTTTIISSLSELGRDKTKETQGVSQVLSSLTSMGMRDWVFMLFGLSFLLLLIYAGELAHKRQLLTHRFELLAFFLFFGILIITFNFGFIRV